MLKSSSECPLPSLTTIKNVSMNVMFEKNNNKNKKKKTSPDGLVVGWRFGIQSFGWHAVSIMTQCQSSGVHPFKNNKVRSVV